MIRNAASIPRQMLMEALSEILTERCMLSLFLFDRLVTVILQELIQLTEVFSECVSC